MDLVSIATSISPSLTIPAALLVAGVVPAGVWLIGFRWQSRREGRATAETVLKMMTELVDTQREELKQSRAIAAQLAVQVGILSEGRDGIAALFRDVVDDLIAARAMLHEAEREIGRPLTVFPPVPKLPSAMRAPAA